MLVYPVSHFGQILLPEVVYTDLVARADNAVGGVYSESNRPIGDAPTSGDRVVVVAGYTVSVGTSPIATCTIGGSAATSIVQARSGGAGAFLFQRVLNTGTTATIVVTLDGNAARCLWSTYAIYHLSNTTPADSAITLSDAGSLACDTVAGSIVIAGAGENATGAETCTWTGVTEQHETSSESATVYSSGMATATVAEVRTINADFSGSPSLVRGVAATWR